MDGIMAVIAAIIGTAYTTLKLIKFIKDGCPPTPPSVARIILPSAEEVQRFGFGKSSDRGCPLDHLNGTGRVIFAGLVQVAFILVMVGAIYFIPGLKK